MSNIQAGQEELQLCLLQPKSPAHTVVLIMMPGLDERRFAEYKVCVCLYKISNNCGDALLARVCLTKCCCRKGRKARTLKRTLACQFCSDLSTMQYIHVGRKYCAVCCLITDDERAWEPPVLYAICNHHHDYHMHAIRINEPAPYFLKQHLPEL